MRRIPLICIIMLALFLRLWQLSHVPPSPSLDEVSIGWNAYSLIHTGADEYGTRLPVLLQAYDDWRPALYVYLVMPFISLFGLTVTAVRLPSVILSVLSVVATYFLAKELFTYKSNATNKAYRLYAPLLAALFLAISPWHLYISRLGHEVNAGISFLIVALLFFFRKSYVLAAFFFSLSFMSYQSEKVIIPVIVISLSSLYYQELLNKKKQVVIAIILGLVITIPFLQASLKPDALIRFQGTNILSANEPVFMEHAIARMQSLEKGDMLAAVRHNRRIVAAEIIAQQYTSHFNPRWLFFNAGRDAHKVPGLGILWIWEGVLLLTGLYALYKKYVPVRSGIVLLVLILSAPLPASITTGAPHAMRSFTAIPAVQMLVAIGAIFLFEILRKKGIVAQKISMGVVAIVFVVSFGFLYPKYFVVFPREQSDSFQYSLNRAIVFVKEHDHEYERIVFSNEDDLYQSYMFYLFNTNYDPGLYQQDGGTVTGGYAEPHKFGKYEFRPINWESEEKIGRILYVGNTDDFPSNISPIERVSHLSGEPSIVIVGATDL